MSLLEICAVLGTGLRNRFFLTILGVLLLVTLGSLYFYSLLLRKERTELIDRQIRQIAASLIDAELGELRRIDFDRSDELLTAELGPAKTRKFFVIRSGDGDIQFESPGAVDLPFKKSMFDRQWFDFLNGASFVRGLNIKLPQFQDRVLTVGLILESEVVNGNYFTSSSALFISSVILVGLLVSYFLTFYLLKPIARLDKFLVDIVSISNLQQKLPSVPVEITGSLKYDSDDEFERVVQGLSALIVKVNKSYQFSRQWGYQMAHEIKTPLSLLLLGLERVQKKHGISDEALIPVRTEIGKVSDTVNSFLGWAELENSSWQKHLNVNHISEAVGNLVKRIPSPDRVQLQFENELLISANALHLEQLLQNLIQNALKHTPAGTPVTVELTGHSLSIEDGGQGMSSIVFERLGEPFNKGSNESTGHTGHGLGLAWVTSICRIYGWKLEFLNTGHGLRVTVRFDQDAIIQPYLQPSRSL